LRSITAAAGVYAGMIQKSFESFHFVYNLLGKLKRKFWIFVALSVSISLWEAVVLVSLLSLAQTLVGAFGIAETHLPTGALTRLASDIGSSVPKEWGVVLGIVGTSVIVLANSLATYYLSIYQINLSTKFLMNLRNRMFRQLIQSTMEFFDREIKGELINLIVFEAKSIYGVLKGGLSFFFASTKLLIFASMMMLLSWELTAIFIVFSLVFGIETLIVALAIRRKASSVVEATRSLTVDVETVSQSIKQVKLYNLYEEVQVEFQNDTRVSDETSRDIFRLQAVQRIILNVITLGFLITIGLLSFYFSIIAASALVTFLYLSQRAAGALFETNTNVGVISRALPRVQKVKSYLNSRRENKEYGTGQANVTLLKEAVRWENVTHSFRKQLTLKSVNISVNKGEIVAFVGHSGCGKTTLINLLCGLYRPAEGLISIDGEDLRSLSLDFVRSKIGVVTQESVLFNKTIWENLLHGRRESSSEAVMSAAIDARVDDFVKKFPEGYQTTVGERGARLSGGERQRINIAQALVRNPEILILDEGTSGLDVETEDLVLDSLCSLEKDFTLILVAHRVSTIRRANRIFVLDKGHVMEQGTWSHLMGTQGRLFEMVSKGKKIGELL
jgi:ATP-binding cassette, subfamily B, bacterial MsbA